MRKVTLTATVAVAALACLLTMSPGARSQSAPKVDRDDAERQRLDRESKIARRVAEAREGKCVVIKVDELKLGKQAMVRVMLDDVKGRRVALVPCFLSKDKKTWSPPEDMVKALKAVPAGYFETINTEMAYGVEWIVGVGQLSPNSLKNLEKAVKGRSWSPTETKKTDGDGAAGGADGDVPVVEGTATGRVATVKTGQVGGIEATCLVVERGIMLTRTEFWLVSEDRKGNLQKAKRDVVRAAEKIKKGDRVKISYLLKAAIHRVVSIETVE